MITASKNKTEGMTRHGHGLMHAAESGAYGEALIRLELSRAGWQIVLSSQGVASDILAVTPSGRRRICISVKCRDRVTRNTANSTFIFREKGTRSADEEIGRFKKICDLLGAEPWIAIVTIMPEFTYAHLISLKHYQERYEVKKVRNKEWKNTADWLTRYAADSEVLGNKVPGVQGVWNL